MALDKTDLNHLLTKIIRKKNVKIFQQEMLINTLEKDHKPLFPELREENKKLKSQYIQCEAIEDTLDNHLMLYQQQVAQNQTLLRASDQELKKLEIEYVQRYDKYKNQYNRIKDIEDDSKTLAKHIHKIDKEKRKLQTDMQTINNNLKDIQSKLKDKKQLNEKLKYNIQIIENQKNATEETIPKQLEKINQQMLLEKIEQQMLKQKYDELVTNNFDLNQELVCLLNYDTDAEPAMNKNHDISLPMHNNSLAINMIFGDQSIKNNSQYSSAAAAKKINSIIPQSKQKKKKKKVKHPNEAEEEEQEKWKIYTKPNGTVLRLKNHKNQKADTHPDDHQQKQLSTRGEDLEDYIDKQLMKKLKKISLVNEVERANQYHKLGQAYQESVYENLLHSSVQQSQMLQNIIQRIQNNTIHQKSNQLTNEDLDRLNKLHIREVHKAQNRQTFHKDQNKAIRRKKAKCLHPMKKFTTHLDGYYCALCKQDFRAQSIMYTCKLCNYDQCHKCHLKTRNSTLRLENYAKKYQFDAKKKQEK